MGINIDMTDFNDEMERIGGNVSSAIHPSARAGARVIYDRAREIALSMKSRGDHWFYGTASKNAPPGQKKQFAYKFSAGTLHDSIYHAFSKDNSIPGQKHVFHVSWNWRKCPYAAMVENGTKKAPARSFIRRSIVEQTEAAYAAMEETFWKEAKWDGA